MPYDQQSMHPPPSITLAFSITSTNLRLFLAFYSPPTTKKVIFHLKKEHSLVFRFLRKSTSCILNSSPITFQVCSGCSFHILAFYNSFWTVPLIKKTPLGPSSVNPLLGSLQV